METSIIKIGNSQGLIIPKRMLKRLGVRRKVELRIQDDGLLIVPVEDIPRKGWAEAFAKASKKQEPEGDYFEGIENDFDKNEWIW